MLILYRLSEEKVYNMTTMKECLGCNVDYLKKNLLGN